MCDKCRIIASLVAYCVNIQTMVTITKPSPSELTILKTLWKQSPLSAKEVHQHVEDELQWSFSSTRKTLDRMLDKKLLGSKEVHGVKVYLAKASKVKTLASFIKDFTQKVLELDGPLPVSMFADSKLLEPEELEELEAMLGDNNKLNGN